MSTRFYKEKSRGGDENFKLEKRNGDYCQNRK